MLTAYHPCRVPLAWAAQQLGFETDQLDEVRVRWEGGGSACWVSSSSNSFNSKLMLLRKIYIRLEQNAHL